VIERGSVKEILGGDASSGNFTLMLTGRLEGQARDDSKE
jgi:hypothetical protein